MDRAGKTRGRSVGTKVVLLQDQCEDISSRRRSSMSAFARSRSILAFVAGCTRARTRKFRLSCTSLAANACRPNYSQRVSKGVHTNGERSNLTCCTKKRHDACLGSDSPRDSALVGMLYITGGRGPNRTGILVAGNH